MGLQELRSSRRFVIELRNVAVPLGVIVVRIDDDLARERLDRNRTVVLQGH